MGSTASISSEIDSTAPQTGVAGADRPPNQTRLTLCYKIHLKEALCGNSNARAITATFLAIFGHVPRTLQLGQSVRRGRCGNSSCTPVPSEPAGRATESMPRTAPASSNRADALSLDFGGDVYYPAPMSKVGKIHRRSTLLSFRFLFAAVFGSVLMGLVAAFGHLSAQLSMLGCFICIAGCLFLAYLGLKAEREDRGGEMIERLAAPLTFSSGQDLYRPVPGTMSGAGLARRSNRPGPPGDRWAYMLDQVVSQLELLAGGTVVFADTEAGWRV